MIYVFLSQVFVVVIYALFPPNFLASKWTPHFFTFRMYDDGDDGDDGIGDGCCERKIPWDSDLHVGANLLGDWQANLQRIIAYKYFLNIFET